MLSSRIVSGASTLSPKSSGALWSGCLAMLLACSGAPTTNAPTDWENRPALAGTCDAAPPQLGERNYYWLFTENGGTCRNYLEQDECVLSVFKDCANNRKQWYGKVRAEKNLELSLIREDGEVSRAGCFGQFSSEQLDPFGEAGKTETRYSSTMTCPGESTPKIHLESVLSKNFHRNIESQQRIVLRTIGASQPDLLPEAEIVKYKNQIELWTVFSGELEGSTDASLDIFLTSAEQTAFSLQTSRQTISIPKLRSIAWAGTSSTVWAGAGTDILKIDVETKEIEIYETLPGQIKKIDIAPDEKHLFVVFTSSISRSFSFLRKLPVPYGDGLAPVVSNLAISDVGYTDTEVKSILFPTQTSSQTPGVIVVTLKSTGGFAYDFPIYTYTDDLDLLAEISREVSITDVVLIDERQRLGFLTRNVRQYQEMDFDGVVDKSLDRVYWIPWMSGPAALAYDSVGKKMFIGSAGFAEKSNNAFVVGCVDLLNQRVMPEKLILEGVSNGMDYLPLKLSFDKELGYLYPMITNQAYFFGVESPWPYQNP